MTLKYLHSTSKSVFTTQVLKRPPTLYPWPRAPQPTNPFVQRPTRQFSQLGMPLNRAFQKLMEGGLLTQLASRPIIISVECMSDLLYIPIELCSSHQDRLDVLVAILRHIFFGYLHSGMHQLLYWGIFLIFSIVEMIDFLLSFYSLLCWS